MAFDFSQGMFFLLGFHCKQIFSRSLCQCQQLCARAWSHSGSPCQELAWCLTVGPQEDLTQIGCGWFLCSDITASYLADSHFLIPSLPVKQTLYPYLVSFSEIIFLKEGLEERTTSYTIEQKLIKVLHWFCSFFWFLSSMYVSPHLSKSPPVIKKNVAVPFTLYSPLSSQAK